MLSLSPDGTDVLSLRSGLSRRDGFGRAAGHQTGDFHDGAPQHHLPSAVQTAEPSRGAPVAPQKSSGR